MEPGRHAGSAAADESCGAAASSPAHTQSTQAPQMDFGTAGTDTAAVSHVRLRGMVRQLNAFSRQDLLLGRFELLGPHHRRQGGARAADLGSCAPKKMQTLTCLRLSSNKWAV